jgi:photosystem I reaction center subunit XII|uniref:Photosystem I reaction center subunit XII n=2 Tax=Euglena mutabilis TaxID=38275 RepID=PSAM_EUGMU|nr:RecName: Full=Photosystem I reaction center subunit XII; AltName: Full=PSI-M [Euglena mutabilis]AAF82450.1 photosystem I protein M [Euglena mutabilis]ABB02351.1 photosystem I protein M [Euglena mutabilis]AMD08083.1 photosystem I M-polypeptide [Euglena mutabilis]
MGITSTQIYIALLTALIPAFFALKLGRELNK